jgi:DNA mismatch repair protein MutL
MTLGFRGEALAAISSVSDMRIMSKRREDVTGNMLEVRGGTLLGVTEHGCREGTTVIVENLFANVPARRKFLKRDATEAMAVSANVERVALSHPEIAVRLISDGSVKLETAGDGKLMSAIYAVFGREFAGKLIPIDGELEGIRVTGYIGRSDNVKANRNSQHFFINHRYVRSKTATAAIEQAYVSYIPPEKFPCGVINIDLNPARVDVNVHPAKLEVKFSAEKPVFEAIYYTVRNALEQNTSRPTMTMPSPLGGTRVSDATRPIETERPESLARRQVTVDMPAQKPQQERITAAEYLARYAGKGQARPTSQVPTPTVSPRTSEPPRTVTPPTPPAPEPEVDVTIPMEVYEAEAASMAPQPVPSPAPTLEPAPTRPTAPVPETPVASSSTPTEPWRIVGEVFHSYVIVEQGDRMLIIDKHAAHERIIFEELRANLKEREVDSQLLLLPVEVMLMSDEVGTIDAFREELENIGFSFTCQRNTVSVDAIPNGIETGAVPDMFATFAEQLANGTGTARLTRDTAFEKALYQASCKAAIKAGREYPAEHIKWLVEKLMALPDITVCPHGRPVAMEMKKRNIDHQFERC